MGDYFKIYEDFTRNLLTIEHVFPINEKYVIILKFFFFLKKKIILIKTQV